MLAQLHKDFRFQRDLILVRRWQRLLTVRIRFLYTTKNSRDLRWDSFWLFVCFFLGIILLPASSGISWKNESGGCVAALTLRGAAGASSIEPEFSVVPRKIRGRGLAFDSLHLIARMISMRKLDRVAVLFFFRWRSVRKKRRKREKNKSVMLEPIQIQFVQRFFSWDYVQDMPGSDCSKNPKTKRKRKRSKRTKDRYA